MIWIWLLAGGVAFVALARPSGPRRRKVRVIAGTGQPAAPGEGVEVDAYEVRTEDRWLCRRGKNVVPDIKAYVPATAITAGGPIAAAVVGGVEIVRKIFDALGASRVCTVVGGRYVAVAVIPAAPLRRILVTVTALVQSHDAVRWSWWTFAAERDSTGPLIATAHNHTSEAYGSYLADGGSPPSQWWPHVNIAKWEKSVPAPPPVDLDVPAAEVVRQGAHLTVYVWLPPRAPRSRVNTWGKRTVVAPIVWQVSVEQ